MIPDRMVSQGYGCRGLRYVTIREGIEGLTENPPKGDIRMMQGYSDGRKRLRIGKYRIIYNYGQNREIKVLYIMNVDTRGDIYNIERKY